MTTSAELLTGRVLKLPDQLPSDVEANARLHFLDALGVGLAAARVGPVRHLAALGIPGSGPCTVLGSTERYSASDAALINGTLIHSIEFDDTHTGSVMHGSSVLAPAVLATAQECGADGRTMLNAFVAGWETIIRIGLAAPSAFQKNGFQGTSVAGTIAGAVAVGLTQRFEYEQLLNSVGIAASFSSGNFTFLSEGASVKAAQPGIAAQGAISSTRLARGGVTGATRVFEGSDGFFGIYARDETANGRFSASLTSLGSEWLISDAAFKEFPCCHFVHPFIEAVTRSTFDISSPENIAEIRCRVPVGQESIIAIPWERKQSPTGANEGRWSLPYAIALQLVTGDVSIEDFEGTPDPGVVELAKRITWEPWSDSGYPNTFPAEIELILRDGSREIVTVADVNGNRTRPWSTEQVVGKFTKNAALALLTEEKRDRILQAFTGTGDLDIDVLSDLAPPLAALHH
ncbi:MmgE/PrpD family protein [Glaciibacter superstes]|uniref:MmgE/PrpD family protein n=1 Tax=Glaciibacter superstes TaxID=501023 RepID=UPI0003B637B6|nr:MmgE/PrpD family protein [Glaciibacter superstes]